MVREACHLKSHTHTWTRYHGVYVSLTTQPWDLAALSVVTSNTLVWQTQGELSHLPLSKTFRYQCVLQKHLSALICITKHLCQVTQGRPMKTWAQLLHKLPTYQSFLPAPAPETITLLLTLFYHFTILFYPISFWETDAICKTKLKKEATDSREAARRWPTHRVLPIEQTKYILISFQFELG